MSNHDEPLDGADGVTPGAPRLTLALAIALTSACARVSAGGEASPELLIAGNENSVWVVRPRGEGADRSVRIYYGDLLAEPTFTSPTLPDRYGVPAGLAVTSDRAHLLFADGSGADMTFARSQTAPDWPGERPPRLWTGDAVRGDVYALCDGARVRLPITATAPTTQPRRRTTQPATQPTAALAPGPVIVRRLFGTWTETTRPPPEASDAATFWMSARDGRVHLFWRTRADDPIRAASWEDGAWSESAEVPSSVSAVAAWASADRVGPLLVLAEPTTGPSACQLRVAWRSDSQWHVSGPLATAEGAVTVDPARLAATVARGRLALARVDTDGRVSVASSALDGDRVVRWTRPLELGVGPPLTPPTAAWGWLEALVLMFVVGAIVWTRRESLIEPAALGPALAPAAPGRRLAALLIDLAPAVLVTAPLWVGPVTLCSWLMPRLVDEGPLVSGLVSSRLAPSWYLVVTVHAVYCAAFELLSGTTPGKHLLRCRVVATGGGRPLAAQILVRSAVRVPELGLTLAAISTLFMMIVMSRNGQRIGDVLAGTYVVRPVPPLARAATPDDASDEAE